MTAEVTASLSEFCPVCSGDPDAKFSLRFIWPIELTVISACLHCPPSRLPVRDMHAYQDVKKTPRGEVKER